MSFSRLTALCLAALGPAGWGLAAAPAQAGTPTDLTFDNLTGSGRLASSYEGISWGNWMYFGQSQTGYDAHSGVQRLYSYYTDSTFTFAAPTVFDGAWFTGFSKDLVTFTLYDAGHHLVATSATLAPSNDSTFLASGYTGLVQSVSLHQTAPDLAVMDNVTFHTPPPFAAPAAIPASVPEPPTGAVLSLGVLGLLALGLQARRRSHAL